MAFPALDQQTRPTRRPAIWAVRDVACILSVATALLLLLAAWAADPIDDALEQCLKIPHGETTAGMTECTHAVYQAYDRQMNTLYQAVVSKTNPVSRKVVRNAQRAWLTYRTAQRAADNVSWRADTGPAASSDIGGPDVEVIRAHIAELEHHPYQPGGRDAIVNNLSSPYE